MTPEASIPAYGIKHLSVILLMLIITLSGGAAGIAEAGPDIFKTCVNPPIQVTSGTEPLMNMAVSPDGGHIVYITGEQKPTRMWIGSADPSAMTLPKSITSDGSAKSSPAISPNGRYVAYVGYGHDVKGDIFLADLKKKNELPSRLTGRDTGDGGPCFSPDNRRLFFHRAVAGGEKHLFYFDLKKRSTPPQPVDTGGDAAFCSVSPDGQKIAFVSFRKDASGDIFFLDMKQGILRQVTSGPSIDLFPRWSTDGKSIYFSRIGFDTNGDNRIDPQDTSIICRALAGRDNPFCFPVTPLNYSAFQPYPAGKKIYFLSNLGGTTNCWALPAEGSIRFAKQASSQLKIADTISRRVPYDPYLSLLAYHRVIEAFPESRAVGARAAYEIGTIYERLHMPASALSTFAWVSSSFAGIEPESSLAKIRQTAVAFQTNFAKTTLSSERQELVEAALSDLASISSSRPGVIAAEARLESADILFEGSNQLSDMLNSIKWLDLVIGDNSADPSQKAHALFLKAQIYGKTAAPGKNLDTFRQVIHEYPGQREWVDRAVERILDLSLAGISETGTSKKIERLHRIAEENSEYAPQLACGALNRIADLYYTSDNRKSAKTIYRQVIETYPALTTQTAAARLSLAEILFKEERFRQALDLYETETRLRPPNDRIYMLARRGYIRKKIETGEFLYRLGEIPAARKTFKELIDYDAGIVEAHRGYIKCAAAAGDVYTVLEKYRKLMTSSPYNPVYVYATALCMTYLDNQDSLKEAETLLRKAIRLNGSIEYFYQTLGYVNEVLETAYGENDRMGFALESYQKAYFLNDHKNNPQNAANLELNLGNAFYLLKQYNKALSYYLLRRDRGIEFPNPDTKILFYKRLGECAFQAGDTNKTIDSYNTALDLIRGRMEPAAPSRAFDRLHRFIMDRVVAPARKVPGTAKQAERLAVDQSAIGIRVAEVTRNSAPPPSPKWRLYKQQMKNQLKKQKKINARALKLANAINAASGNTRTYIKDPDQQFYILTKNIHEALKAPERLIELKSEILDRLALAYQDAGEWKKASTTFEKVFEINRQAGRFQNLAVNRRSAAYNAYRLAETLTGVQKTRQLETAAEGFKQVIELVDQYGVPQPVKKEKQALINLTFQASLNATGETRAAHGFSAIQEKRLAETFISRIYSEMGSLQKAEADMAKQLSAYPVNKPVSAKDIYGVALLYHRAGLLANARGDFNGAFTRFAWSATLTAKMGSPVSTLMNLTNLAAVAEKLLDDNPGPHLFEDRLTRIKGLDDQATALISGNNEIAGSYIIPRFHNTMGVFYANAAGHEKGGIEGSVKRLNLLQRAVIHFNRGIKTFKNRKTRLDRDLLEIKDRLYLNLATTAIALGDREKAGEYFQEALNISLKGLFPDLKWRTLIGLGRTNEALKTLQTVPITRAGCAPFEIITAFAPMVLKQVKNGNAEAAFNLAERISELERYNRTAVFIRPVDQEEIRFYKKVYPRLERLKKLEKKLDGANREQKPYIIKRIADERKLIDQRFGKNNENLPAAAGSIRNRDTQTRVIRLMGTALYSEEIADQIANQNIRRSWGGGSIPGPDNKLFDQYNELISKYRRLAEEAYDHRPLTEPSDFITLMAPEPVELVDVMESLSQGDQVIRIFNSGMKSPEYIVFFITPDKIEAITAIDKSDLMDHISTGIKKDDPYIVYEAPLDLRLNRVAAYALSGTHLYRSIENRKPFKDRLLVVPGTGFNPPAPGPFKIKRMVDILKTQKEREWIRFSDTNTLLVTNGLPEVSTVPIKPEGCEKKFFAVYMDPDTRFPMEKLTSATPNLAAALVAGAPADKAYLLGHLFSIYGCPSVIFFNPGNDNDESIRNFLGAYPSMSAIDALRKTSASRSGKPLLIGFKGMTPKQAEDLAGKNFISYVKSGKSAFVQGDNARAAVMFENAISAASRTKKYEKFLPALYRFGRESAFRAGDLERAAGFAKKLSDLMETQQPGSPAFAEAILRLGLIYAKMEDYDKAVPLIESSVRIMSATAKPGPELVRAMMDLGVVLENATNYEKALRRFTAAADLSQTLNQSELLAAQHLNIGRIYDLRLSRYAAAIVSYKKALDVYEELNDTDKIAEALLDIGRCYRLLGNFPEADQYYQKSMETISGHIRRHPRLYVKVLIEMANNAWFQGRYEEAFKMQRRCYTLAEKNQYPLMQVISSNTAGLIWWTLGNYDKALFEMEKALETARNLAVRRDEIASTLNNIGLVYRDQGRYEKALETFNKALEIDTALKSKWAIAYDYRNTALTYLKLNQPEKAVPLFDKAYAISQSIGNRINAAKALLGKGDALLTLKNFKLAESAYNNSLSLSDEMRIRETQWRALYGLARINLEFHKDMSAAEKLLKKAMGIIEKLRSDIKINRLKENFIADKLSVYKTLVRLLADMNRPAEAFEVAERSRARNFIDLLGNQKLSVGSDTDNRLYNRLRVIKSEIEEYESLLAQSVDPAEQKVYHKSLKDLNNSLENVMLDIQAQNPQLSSLVSVSPVDVNRLTGRLEPGVALVSYYVLDNEIFCWVLNGTGEDNPKNESLKLVRIAADKDELKEKILEYRRVLQNLEPYEKHSKQLYDRLIAPVIPDLKGVHTLGIIPHGPLHYLSFATLFNGREFLVDRFSLFYLPSTGLLDYTLSRRVKRKKDKLEVLAIGNPDLGDPILNLPFAEQEVNAIAWDFPKITVLTRDRATEEWVVDNIGRFDIIHMASHGEFDPVNPLLSAIKLAKSHRPSPTRPDIDGNLEAKEIFGLKLNADMVFLSACQTGLGRIKAGDEVIGLNRSFLYAGTHTIISSLWRVSDVSTAVLIKAFYRRYMTENKADSLKDAARHVKMRYPHPGYWGAFILAGDYY